MNQTSGGYLIENFKDAFVHYADFNGRASRRQYWSFILVHVILYFAMIILAAFADIFAALLLLYMLAVCIPGLSICIRRLHDTDHSGWWGLVPVLSIVYLATAGDPGYNRFGQPPYIQPSQSQGYIQQPQNQGYVQQPQNQSYIQQPQNTPQGGGNVCPKCGKQVAANSQFCPSCGASIRPVKTVKLICPKCYREYGQGMRYCENCGVELVRR